MTMPRVYLEVVMMEITEHGKQRVPTDLTGLYDTTRERRLVESIA